MRKRIISICLTLALVLGGFMGIEQMKMKERKLTIVDVSSEPVSAESSDTGNLKVKAKSAALIDGSSGQVLWEQNSHKHLPPASVTKVMTLLLVMDACESGKISYEDQVTVSQRAAGMGGSQMYMEAGEQHTVEELLKGVIMVSANDGCVALAEYLHGSVEDFVEAMNRKAHSLGLKDSHFVNTNGLPVADHYSCAYDIGIISKELLQYDKAREWFAMWQDEIKVGLPGKEKPFTLTNTNKLIRRYNGAIGIKTGFTQDAGYCLSGATERNGTTMIAVVLGCETSDIRFAEAARILDYGFAGYETAELAQRGECLKLIPLEKATKKRVGAVTQRKIGLTVKKGEKNRVKVKVNIEKDLKLPIKKGQRIGTAVVYQGTKPAQEYPLTADCNVQKAGYWQLYIQMMKKLN